MGIKTAAVFNIFLRLEFPINVMTVFIYLLLIFIVT
jgi:hypothetical protein